MSPLREENSCCHPIIAQMFFKLPYHFRALWWKMLIWMKSIGHPWQCLSHFWPHHINHTQSRTIWPISFLLFFLPLLPAFCFPSSWKYLCSPWDGNNFFYRKVLHKIFFPSDMTFLIYSPGRATYFYSALCFLLWNGLMYMKGSSWMTISMLDIEEKEEGKDICKKHTI